MKPDSKIYRTYVKIPERELVCAEVCTEPVAPACCAAKARSEPGRLQKNKTILLQGRRDVPLDEVGIRQAKEL